MDHVLSVPLCLCVELERRLVKSPELSEGTLERSGLGRIRIPVENVFVPRSL